VVEIDREVEKEPPRRGLIGPGRSGPGGAQHPTDQHAHELLAAVLAVGSNEARFQAAGELHDLAAEPLPGLGLGWKPNW
jgi:hypothetical protein